jgi:predicted nucleotidyltransferase component of viral defense system
MLHTETVEPGTFSLLKELSNLSFLKSYALVGGTALSLKFGHRTSVDLDFFTTTKDDLQELTIKLQTHFEERYLFEKTFFTVGHFCYLDGIKTDFVYHQHVMLNDFEIIEGVKMFSNEDIAAMKIQAILGRGQKKDFWDIFELLKIFSLEEIIEFHTRKYPTQMLAISIPNALTYFQEANLSDEPISLNGQTWEMVKSGIQKKVRDYLI